MSVLQVADVKQKLVKAEKDLETARVEKNNDAAGSSDEVENLRHKLQV